MKKLCHFLLVVTVLAVVSNAGRAAELHLRRACECIGPLVTLGDVAEIYALDEVTKSDLSKIELFPAPADGQARVLRSRELQDILSQRGVDLRNVRVAGASAGRIVGRRPVPTAVNSPNLTAWQQMLEDKVAVYLRDSVDNDVAWQVQAKVSDGELRGCDDPQTVTQVSGGTPPWIGRQNFVAVVDDQGTRRTIRFTAQVTRPIGVVVPVRPLARGEVIQAGDLQIQSDAGEGNRSSLVSNIDHVIGYETTRALPAGRPVQQSDVRPPVLVERNNVVAVFARTRGIQVRTQAKALENGSRDDLIKVQSLLDRDDEYLARVVGHKEVEVFAGPPRIESPVTTVETAGHVSNSANRLELTRRPSLFGLRVESAESGATE